MRTTFYTLGAAAVIGSVLTACGGGSSSSSQSTVPLPSSSIPPVVQGITPTGPTAPMTITIAIPQHVTTTAAAHALVSKRIHALYGAKSSDSRIRTMANTSPSASIRQAGAQLEKSAKQIELKTGRSPEYVSPGTYYMELVMSSGATNVSDQTAYCSVSSNQCSATFNVPVGTGFTAALYLYDDCDYLLSAGAASNVTIVSGSNAPLTITLNPVVAYFDVTATATTPFIADPSQAQTFNVSVTPLDAEYYNNSQQNVVTTPGVLVDSTFHQITSVTLALSSAYPDVTPSGPQTLNVPVLAQNSINTYTFPTTSYTFGGTGTEGSVVWTATPNTVGSPIVPTNERGPYSDGTPSPGTNVGSLSITDNPVALSWTNPQGYPQSSGDPVIASQGTGTNVTYWSAEFPNPANTSTYTFGLNENIPFSGNITLSDNGQCVSSVVSSYTPTLGTYPFSQLNTSPYVLITMNSSSNTAACIVTATDDAATPRSTQLQIFVDSSTLTIQNKARAH